MSSRVSQLRELWFKDPSLTFNVTTKERKELMLADDLTIIYHGYLFDIKFKNIGGGIWKMFTQKKEYQTSHK